MLLFARRSHVCSLNISVGSVNSFSQKIHAFQFHYFKESYFTTILCHSWITYLRSRASKRLSLSSSSSSSGQGVLEIYRDTRAFILDLASRNFWLFEITLKLTNYSLKIKIDWGKCHSWISWFTQMVISEITFAIIHQNLVTTHHYWTLCNWIHKQRPKLVYIL